MAVTLKLRTAARFLASIFSGTGTSVRKDGLATYVDLDFSSLTPLLNYDPASQKLVAQSSADKSLGTILISQILSFSQTEQDISAGATVNVAAGDGMIKINKTIGSPTTVNLPAASSKTGPVKIVDWKGDAGTNNITINCVGTDKLNGNVASWIIASNGASIVATPLKDGSGYAI